MPSFDIHLAIAREFLKKNNNIMDSNVFVYGNIKPDLTNNKALTHYPGEQDKNDLIQYFKNKVRIDNFLKYNAVITDVDKGIFLHLLTDYLFFNKFISRKYVIQ